MRYIGNAFSLGMLSSEETVLKVRTISPEAAAEMVAEWNGAFTSVVGHADTAALIERVLGVAVPPNRVGLALTKEDVLLVCQYNGPRLPEGATQLPEGATVRWMVVSFVVV